LYKACHCVALSELVEESAWNVLQAPRIVQLKEGDVKDILQKLTDVVGRDADEEETTTYSTEEIGTRRSSGGERKEGQPSQGFTVERIERVVEMIDELPSDVSRESASHIVRAALTAAGIELSNFDRSTSKRASQLCSEIERARRRQKEFREQTEETVHALEEEIRKAREDCEATFIEEKKKIARASAALKEVERVRTFFELPKTAGDENIGLYDQAMHPLGVVATRARWLSGLPTDTNRTTQGAAEDVPEYKASHDTDNERAPSSRSDTSVRSQSSTKGLVTRRGPRILRRGIPGNWASG